MKIPIVLILSLAASASAQDFGYRAFRELPRLEEAAEIPERAVAFQDRPSVPWTRKAAEELFGRMQSNESWTAGDLMKAWRVGGAIGEGQQEGRFAAAGKFDDAVSFFRVANPFEAYSRYVVETTRNAQFFHVRDPISNFSTKERSTVTFELFHSELNASVSYSCRFVMRVEMICKGERIAPDGGVYTRYLGLVEPKERP